MNIDRKRKYTKRKKVDPIQFNFDLTMLNLFCSYVISENTSIHNSSIMTLFGILNKIDESIFNNDKELILRYRFCKQVLNSRVIKKLYNKEIIIKDVYGVFGEKFELDYRIFEEMSNIDVNWVESSIASCANIMYINNNIMDLYNKCNEYIHADYKDKINYIDDIKESISNAQNQFRRNDVESDDEDSLFVLSNPTNTIRKVIERKNRPSNKLSTGIQGLNYFLSGGYEGSRVYCFFGLPGR